MEAAPAPPVPHFEPQCQENPSAAETHCKRNPRDDDTNTTLLLLEQQKKRKKQVEPNPMANFRAFVIQIAESDPTKPLTDARKTLIENRIRDFFPDTHTPDHPTYAAMIHRAILELNEEGGSSEESISNFMKREYNDLPWAHSTFLKHHLRKLCKSGEIVVTSEKCYLIGDAINKPTPVQSTGPGRKRLGRPRKNDLIKEEMDLVASPKRRGRPRKKDLIPKRQGTPLKEDLIKEEMDVIAIPKRRGRPRKKGLIKEEMDVIASPERRGRPRKKHVIKEENRPEEEEMDAITSPEREQLKTKQRKEWGRSCEKDVINEENQLNGEMENTGIEFKVTHEQNEVQNKLTENWYELFEELKQMNEEKYEVIVEECQNEANIERSQKEFRNEVVGNKPQEQENECSDVWNQPQKQNIGIIEEHQQKEQNVATEGQTLSEEQQIEVIDENSQSLEQRSGVNTGQDQRHEQGSKLDREQNQQVKQQNEVVEEQNQDRYSSEVRGKSLQFYSKGEGGAGDDLNDLPCESPGTMRKEKEELPEEEGRQRRIPCKEGELIDICGLRVEHSNPEKSPESKPTERLSWSQDHRHQQQEYEKPHHRKILLRLRLPKPEPATVATMAEPLPVEHQHEKQQEPDCNDLVRPAETLLNISATIDESSIADQQYQAKQQQPVQRGRGRPRKLKSEAAATTELLLHSNYQHNPQLQQQQEQPKRRGRPPKCESSDGRNVENSQKQKQPKRQGRGRPRKQVSGIQGR